jgi:hypothetical protein
MQMIMRSKICIFLLLVLCTMTSLLSCTRGDEGKEEASTIREEVSAEPGPLTEGTFSVEVIPEKPTVTRDLQVLFSGDISKVTLQWMRNGRPIVGATGVRLGRDSFKKGDRVSVIAHAGGVEKGYSVLIGNSPPSVKEIRLMPELIYRGVDIVVEVTGSDPDGDKIGYEYQWIIDEVEDMALDGPALKGDMYRRGSKVAIRVTPYDEDDKGDPYTMKPVEVPNAPPSFISTPPDAFEGRTYTYKVYAIDPDGDGIRYSLSSAPEGMEIDRVGMIRWAIGDDDGGTHEIEVVISDAYGSKTFQRYSITISIPEV